jgi:hypothetical protein
MIFILITVCLIKQDYEIRKQQYINGISKAKEYLSKIPDIKICIIENNGKRETFLDMFDIEVLYTNNNSLHTNNKGIKELQDVKDAIDYFKIQESDFIVKLTGRYILQENSEFLQQLTKFNPDKTDCIIRFGTLQQYNTCHKVAMCASFLIGMKCKYVKQIGVPAENESVERRWAIATFSIDLSRIVCMEKLGILVCPGHNTYFLV